VATERGRNHQVICVTHLPQIASFADTHYNVNKQVFDERTITIVNELRPEQRVREIAQIMGGSVTDFLNEKRRRAARSLLPVERDLDKISAAAVREKDYTMSTKKFMSTVLLFAVFFGSCGGAISMLSDPHKDGETTVYAILILGCSLYALISLLLLPRKRRG